MLPTHDEERFIKVRMVLPQLLLLDFPVETETDTDTDTDTDEYSQVTDRLFVRHIFQ